MTHKNMAEAASEKPRKYTSWEAADRERKSGERIRYEQPHYFIEKGRS